MPRGSWPRDPEPALGGAAAPDHGDGDHGHEHGRGEGVGDAGHHDDGGDRWARAALTALVEPGDAALRRLLAVSSPARVLDQILGRRDGGERLELWRARLADLDVGRDLARVTEIGGRFLVPGDPEWPAGIEDLGDRRPLGLWVAGPCDLAAATRRSVAVVGARASTGYGEHVATEITADLAEQGWCIVSGAAYGIDGAAHRAALAVGGMTVAVLACGVDAAYPRGHEGLIGRIRREGLLVSELPPGATPTRSRFLTRNRLIAALATGTLVAEAALRSGTGRTAAVAAALMRPVMAVPGPVTSAMSAGCHELVRGAKASLVTDAADVLDLLEPLGVAEQGRRRGAPTGRDALDPLAQRVLEAVPPSDVRDVERIAAAAGVDLPTARRQLGVLAADDLVVRGPGGWRLVRGARARLAAPETSAGRPPRRRGSDGRSVARGLGGGGD